MKASNDTLLAGSLPFGRDADSEQVLRVFPVEELQHLDHTRALRCQEMLGHGKVLGIWETPKAMIGRMKPHMRSIDIRRRLRARLDLEIEGFETGRALLDEAVIWMLRWACLMALGPVSMGKRTMNQRLDATTIALRLYAVILTVVARGITRRFEDPDLFVDGFVRCLAKSDLEDLQQDKMVRDELARLVVLSERGLWNDAPCKFDFEGSVTTPRGDEKMRPSQKKSEPYAPIPDDYMAAIGPRVLWLIHDLGPNLIHFIEALPKFCPYIADKCSVNNNGRFELSLSKYFTQHVWRDREGKELAAPPFPLKHGSGRGKHNIKAPSKGNQYEWPPRNWDSFKTLSVCLQSAHLWIALLAMAGRIGEILTLPRNCIEWARDGQPYANGRTYKLSRRLAGEERQWPAPELLIDALAQQVKLVEAWQRIGRIMYDTAGIELLPVEESEHLWASIGSGKASPESELGQFDEALQRFAVRLGMTAKPGGINLHAHRFRKTIARLGALAIVGSPKVLMRLLGHKDITMTLGYMLTDPALAKEIDDIAREIRVMRAEELVADMYTAMHEPGVFSFGGHGGGGAPVLSNAVRNHENELYRTGKNWGVDTAHELAILLTNNGQSMRLVSEHVVCTKADGEVGLCSPKKGAPNTGNCKSKCNNRIEEKTARRDVHRVIPILVANANKAIASNDLLVLASYAQQLTEEMERFEDIGAQWRKSPDVVAIFEAAA